jgi:4,5-dihydroxyphthalate decarboxylase
MTTSVGLNLKTASGAYGHNEALRDGSLAVDRVKLEYVDVQPNIIAAFRRMCRDLEFDVSEMAITTYLAAKQYGLPFTAIPVFPVRGFHSGAFVVNTNVVKEPKDLEGKKAGVRAYTVTTGVWAKGIVASELGVDLDKVTWVMADEEHVEAFHKDAPPNAVYQLGADLAKMTVEGELAGGVVGRTDSPDIKPLIGNAREVDAAMYKKSGLYPINHTVVIKDSILAENPWLAPALFEAFKESKQRWLAKASDEDKARAGSNIVQGDPFPYGIEANRPALETIIKYAYDQHILKEQLKPEALFVKGTENLS